MIHCSLVRWMQAVHMSSNRQLERTVDFEDVQYDSSIIQSLRGASSAAAYPSSGLHGDTSLWTQFWRKHCNDISFEVRDGSDNIDWESISRQCILAVKPSCLSDFTSFLYGKGQYACVARCTAVALAMDDLPGVISPPPTPTDQYTFNYGELSSYFSRCRNKSMHAISFMQSHLRDICNVSYDISPDGNCDDSLQKELQRSLESIIELPAYPEVQAEGRLYSYDENEMEEETNVYNRDQVSESIASWIRESLQVCEGLFEKKRLLCFGEALIKLSYTGSFRVLYQRLLLESVASEIHPIVTLVRSYPDMLLRMYSLSHHSNAQRLMDRARSVLPSLCGDTLALRACYCTVDSIQTLKNYLFSSMDDWSLSPALLYELDIEWAAVWSSVFKFALHSTLLDEALAAILELIKLWKTNVSVGGAVAGRTSSDFLRGDDVWRSSLRALITKACATGHLGWLCSLPDTVGGSEGDDTVVDLCAEIASEMEFLASSSDFADMANLSSHASCGDDMDAMSMYEYLGTFFLVKRDYAECARVMYQFYGRLEVEGPVTLGCVSVKARYLIVIYDMPISLDLVL